MFLDHPPPTRPPSTRPGHPFSKYTSLSLYLSTLLQDHNSIGRRKRRFICLRKFNNLPAVWNTLGSPFFILLCRRRRSFGRAINTDNKEISWSSRVAEQQEQHQQRTAHQLTYLLRGRGNFNWAVNKSENWMARETKTETGQRQTLNHHLSRYLSILLSIPCSMSPCLSLLRGVGVSLVSLRCEWWWWWRCWWLEVDKVADIKH